MSFHQAGVTEYSVDAGGTRHNYINIEHHERETPVTLKRVFIVKLDDGLLFPVFEPSVARNLAIMLVDLAIALPPVIELALAQADPLNKHGIGQSMYYRWRQKCNLEKVGTDRRCCQLELDLDWLKKLIAELLVDRTMLQNVAKKVVSPDQQ